MFSYKIYTNFLAVLTIHEPISKVLADDGQRRPALSDFTLCGKARNTGQVGHGERFSAPQRVLKLAPELTSKVFTDDEKMIVDGRRRPALSGFTLCGKARNTGQVGHGERFSAPQRVLKLALVYENTRILSISQPASAFFA